MPSNDNAVVFLALGAGAFFFLSQGVKRVGETISGTITDANPFSDFKNPFSGLFGSSDKSKSIIAAPKRLTREQLLAQAMEQFRIEGIPALRKRGISIGGTPTTNRTMQQIAADFQQFGLSGKPLSLIQGSLAGKQFDLNLNTSRVSIGGARSLNSNSSMAELGRAFNATGLGGKSLKQTSKSSSSSSSRKKSSSSRNITRVTSSKSIKARQTTRGSIAKKVTETRGNFGKSRSGRTITRKIVIS